MSKKWFIADEFSDIIYTADNKKDVINFVTEMSNEIILTFEQAVAYLHDFNFSIQLH